MLSRVSPFGMPLRPLERPFRQSFSQLLSSRPQTICSFGQNFQKARATLHLTAERSSVNRTRSHHDLHLILS